MRDYRTHRPGSYQEMTSGFRWEVPASYNLAADVLDKHEPERPAMRFVSDEGRDERWTFGDIRRLTDRTANTLRALGVGKGDRVAVWPGMSTATTWPSTTLARRRAACRPTAMWRGSTTPEATLGSRGL